MVLDIFNRWKCSVARPNTAAPEHTRKEIIQKEINHIIQSCYYYLLKGRGVHCQIFFNSIYALLNTEILYLDTFLCQYLWDSFFPFISHASIPQTEWNKHKTNYYIKLYTFTLKLPDWKIPTKWFSVIQRRVNHSATLLLF